MPGARESRWPLFGTHVRCRITRATLLILTGTLRHHLRERIRTPFGGIANHGNERHTARQGIRSVDELRIKSLTRCDARRYRLLKLRLQPLTLLFVDDPDPRTRNHELLDGGDGALFLVEGDVVFKHVDGVLST